MSDPTPTDSRQKIDHELNRWRRMFSGEEFYYGDEPGPVARRAVRYHRHFSGAKALDAGCGEGQDLVYLAGLGYTATGVEFTPEGAAKSRQLAAQRRVPAEVIQQDLRAFLTETSAEERTGADRQFDLVLAVNSLQFLGRDASGCLDRLMSRVAPGGVIGVSLFAREPHEAEVSSTLYFTTLEELLRRFAGWQPLEAARVWQWNVSTNEPQPFVTLIARNTPPMRQGLVTLG
jgi:SAM-dependent methyltransferase